MKKIKKIILGVFLSFALLMTSAPFGMQAEPVFAASGATYSYIDVGLQIDRYACKPNGVTVDSSGNIYVSVQQNEAYEQFNLVLKYNSALDYQAQWNGADGFYGKYNFPYGITTDGTNLYIADSDNWRVQKCNSSGVFINNYKVSNYSYPKSITRDADGNIYVTVRRSNGADGGIVKMDCYGNCVYAAYTGFTQPSGIAVDSTGTILYVSDAGTKTVYTVDAATGEITDTFAKDIAGYGPLLAPKGIAVDSNGYVYIADSNFAYPAVVMLTNNGQFVKKLTDKKLLEPAEIALDSKGKLYVTCPNARSVAIIDEAPSLVSTNPAKNATDAVANGPLKLTFSRSVTPVAGQNIYIKNSSGATIKTIDVSDTQVSVANNTVTINPSAPLSYNTAYNIQIDSGAFVDGSGNAYEGISNATTWCFKTAPYIQSSAKAITGFTLSGVNGTINEADHTIAVTLPSGTDVTNLTPTITVSDKASILPASGTATDFTNPVTYTVTAENGTTQTYTVTAAPYIQSSAKAITGFTLGGVDGTINEADHTIAVTLPYGTDVTNLTPIITVSDKASVSPASGTAKDFTNPVTYTVTAENSTTQDYTVTVEVAPDTKSSAKAITGFTLGGVDGTINEANHTIALTLPYGTDVTNLTPIITVSDKASVSPASGTAKDFTNPVTYTVTAENSTTQDYTVTVEVAPDTKSSAKAITGFTIGAVDGTINETGHTITVTLPNGTDVTNLTPIITVSDKASISPASGAATNFTNPVTYTVTAENSTTQDYTVTVEVAPDTHSAPKLITGTVSRTSDTKATVTFSTNEVGTYHYYILGASESAPDAATILANGVSGSMTVGNNTISPTTLTAGAKNLYIVACDASDNKSNILTITLVAYTQNNFSGGGGGTGGASTTNSQITTTKEIVKGGTVSYVIGTTTAQTTNSDSNGKVTAVVTGNQITDAVAMAVTEAAKLSKDTKTKVEIKVTAPANAKSVETSVQLAAVKVAVDIKISGLTLSTPIANITFDHKALGTIEGVAAGDVKITASKVDTANLSEEVKTTVGGRPVYNFSVTSGEKVISQFGGKVTVSVPYTPKPGEDPNAIVIYYINAEGKPERVGNCVYNPSTATITFETNHFSTYAVGYNKINFKDVPANAWYGDAVSFVAARDITTGVGDGNYCPNAKLTRGQFLVMVMRAYGIEADSASKYNFSDAGNTYYTGYLAAAKSLGITDGIGNNMFAPGKEITRQEMFTLLYNIMKQIDALPVGTSGKMPNSYTDANEIAAWAKDAMTLFVGTGTISGSGDRLNPADTTNRAQMAQVLYNLLSK